MSEIIYHQIRKGLPSFNVENSDVSTNALFMESLVGTLVKMRGRARFEPYLAENYEVLDAAKKWKFKFRNGLVCENGEVITAERMKSSLLRALLSFSKKMTGNVPVFSTLVDWQNLDKPAFAGIRAEDNVLTLEFSAPVREGLLEFLAMPYFGYLCDANFENGKWKSENSIISSGPYRVVGIQSSDVILSKRTDWAIQDKLAPQTIIVRELTKPPETIGQNEIYEYSDDALTGKTNGTTVLSLPTWFYGYVLSTDSKSPLSSLGIRRALKEKIRDVQERIDLTSPRLQKSHFFYPAQPTDVKVNPVHSSIQMTQPLKIVRSFGSSPGAKFLESVLLRSLEELHVPFQVTQLDRSSPTFFADFMSGQWDIRLQGVDIGGGVENWAIRMMFCSKMGAHLADPSGRICALATAFDSGSVDLPEYLNRFNQYIEDDAATIPMAHGASAWVFGDSIDLSEYSSAVTLISFETLRFK